MSNRLLARSSWRFFTRHPWQLWLTLLSIALGTAVIIAVDLANQSAGQSFRQSVKVLSGEMTHEITALHGNIPDDFYRQLRVEWGYRDSAPLVETTVVKGGLQYTLLGIDPFAAPLQQGAGMDISAAEVRRLLTEPGAMVKVGDDVLVADIATAQGLKSPLTPLLQRGEPDGATASCFPLCKRGTEGDFLPGLTSIQLKLTEAEASKLQARLPPALKLESFASRQQVFTQMTQAFSTNLLAMSLLAMLVGAFLVYNTMTFSVLQRRQSFAIGRMVGITGGQLFRHLLLEALLLGLVGSFLGVLLGVLLGQGLLVLVTQTISDLYVSVRATDLLLTPDLLLKGVGITLLAVLVATLAPALEAARVAPVQVQRQSSLEQGSQQAGGWLVLAGVVLMLLSGLLIGVSGKSLLPGFIGLFLLIVGYSLCVPLVLRLGLRTLQWGMSGVGVGAVREPPLQLRMAVRGVQASLSRTSLAIIALTVAVSATVGVSIMIGSFRASVAEWLDMTLASDLYVAAASPEASRVEGTLNPAWLERLQSLPGVAAVSTGRTTRLTLEGFPVPVLVLQPGAHSGRGFAFMEGDAAAIWAQFLAGKGVLVSEPFAYHRGKRAGDTVRVATELAGEVELPILGVFQDYSATQGMAVLPRGLYGRYWQDRSISSIGLKLAQGVQADAIKRQLASWAGELQQAGQPLRVRSNRDIHEFSLQVFDRTFAITHVLRLLVIMVAFVGVFSALMALFLEKGREFAILRATGFTPQQVQWLVMWQSGLIGLLAGLLSLPLGGLMSVVLIEIINQRSFGWTMQTHFFALIPLQAVVLALVAALLASVYPLRRIARLPVSAGLRAL